MRWLMPCVIALQGNKNPHVSSDLERKEEIDERVDGVLGDVALDPDVVVALRIALERSSQLAHLGRRPPGSRDDLTDPTHGLSVRTEVGWKSQSASEDEEDPCYERDEPDHRCKRKTKGQLVRQGQEERRVSRSTYRWHRCPGAGPRPQQSLLGFDCQRTQCPLGSTCRGDGRP